MVKKIPTETYFDEENCNLQIVMLRQKFILRGNCPSPAMHKNYKVRP